MRDAMQADAITSRGRSGDAFTIHVRISMLLARLTVKLNLRSVLLMGIPEIIFSYRCISRNEFSV